MSDLIQRFLKKWNQLDPKDRIRLIVQLLCITVFVSSIGLLAGYFADRVRTQQSTKELAEVYYSTEAPAIATQTPTHSPSPTELPVTAAPVLSTEAAAVQTALPAGTPKATYDPFGSYPNNPYRELSDRFVRLQHVNKDICAWIQISEVLDIAVVQRDNTYYLTHDYSGEKNVNGALFLDDSISLNNRPTAYVVYGHNMKTQEMLGFLYKYDTVSFLRNHSIIRYDTQYEDGEYAVFSSALVNVEPTHSHYVPFFDLPNAVGDERKQIIEKLQALSGISIPLDVDIDDQLLLLVTCTGDDSERRIVAARRLREGESEASLKMTYLLAEQR